MSECVHIDAKDLEEELREIDAHKHSRDVEAMRHVKELLRLMGDDPNREGLVDTPKRVVKSWEELYSGYYEDPRDILSKTFVDGAEKMVDEIVICKDVDFYSMCEHHILPFLGVVHIGYIPIGKVVGISKLVRLVNCFARRLQIQEKMCNQIADAIMTHLTPKGVGVIIEATHMCMTLRGVKSPKSKMVTSAMRGAFREQAKTRNEFLQLIRD